MRDAGVRQILVNCKLCGHDDIVRRGENRINALGYQSGSGRDDLTRGGGSPLGICDALLLQYLLGLGNRGRGVGLGQGVEQANSGDIGVLREHHVDDKLGVERIAGTGDVVDAGQLSCGGVRDSGVYNRGLALLGADGHDLGRKRGYGDNGVDSVGNGLLAYLLEGGLLTLAGVDFVLNGDAVVFSNLVELCGDGSCDLVKRGVVHLLYNGYRDRIVVSSSAVLPQAVRENTSARASTEMSTDLTVFFMFFIIIYSFFIELFVRLR